MKYKIRFLCFLTFVFLLAATMRAADRLTITISNPIPSVRMEMVEVDVAILQKKLQTERDFVVMDADGREIPSQVTHDQKLIFQIGVAGKGKSIYYVQKGTPQKYEVKAKGRLFTERQDEFGWENDCVAYRVYGHGGAVGYDLFNKSTSDLMLDYWYASEQNQEMRSVSQQLRERGYADLADQVYNAFCYHINHGKGMDCYTVGPTLGGGANALLNTDGSLFMPQCYDAEDTVLLADAEKAAKIILGRTLGRVFLGTLAVTYVHPAASQIHSRSRQLDESGGNGGILQPDVGLGPVAHDNDGGRGALHESGAAVAHLRHGGESVLVFHDHEGRTVAVL